VRSQTFEPVFRTVISRWLRGRGTGWAVTAVLEPLQATRAFGSKGSVGRSPPCARSAAGIVSPPLSAPARVGLLGAVASDPAAEPSLLSVLAVEAVDGWAAPSSFAPVPSWQAVRDRV